MRCMPLTIAFAALLTACPTPPEDSDTDTDTGSDTDADTDTDTDTLAGTDCHVLPSTLPEWAGPIDPVSLVTNTPYTNDAGLAALRTAAMQTTDCTDTVEACAETVNIAITDATVTTIGFSPEPTDIDDIWLADANAAIRLHLGANNGYEVVPGDKVSFTATEVSHYNQELQVTAVTNFTVTSSGNPVYVRESNGQTLSYDTDGQYVHHMWGELRDQVDNPDCDVFPCPCGGSSVCFDFVTRSGASESTHEFRIRNGLLTIPLMDGDCVEVMAPLGRHRDKVQFDFDNFSWQRWFGNSEG